MRFSRAHVGEDHGPPILDSSGVRHAYVTPFTGGVAPSSSPACPRLSSRRRPGLSCSLVLALLASRYSVSQTKTKIQSLTLVSRRLGSGIGCNHPLRHFIVR